MFELSWTATVGLTEGYKWNDPTVTFKDFKRKWIKIMEEEYEASSIVVSAVINQSVTTYPSKLGCPENGEITVTLSGVSDSRYSDKFRYQDAVIRCISKIKKEMEQATVRLIFTDSDLLLMDKNWNAAEWELDAQESNLQGQT